MKNDKKELKKPFFANFLESQLSETETKKVNGGVTSPLGDVEVPTTKPAKDIQHTMKYPSDGDDDVNYV